MGWVYMQLGGGNGTWFPDEPGVIEWHEAHGWKQADEPEPTPFVPAKGDASPVNEWVGLEHPATGGKHEFPNNPEALEGAAEAGWEIPPVDEPVEEPAPEPEPVKASAEPEKPAEEVKE